jgi:hypothetical protein
MGLYFRKVFKFGPARVSVSSRGVGASIGGEKTRVGVDALGRPYAATEIAGVYLRATRDNKDGPARSCPGLLDEPFGVGDSYWRYPPQTRKRLKTGYCAALIAGISILLYAFPDLLTRAGPCFAVAGVFWACAAVLFGLERSTAARGGPSPAQRAGGEAQAGPDAEAPVASNDQAAAPVTEALEEGPRLTARTENAGPPLMARRSGGAEYERILQNEKQKINGHEVNLSRIESGSTSAAVEKKEIDTSRPLYLDVVMRYENNDGRIKKHKIEITSIYAGKSRGQYYITGEGDYGDTITFNVKNIKKLTVDDEIIGSPAEYFEDIFFSENSLDRCKYQLKMLLFTARYDGSLTGKERGHIAEYMRKYVKNGDIEILEALTRPIDCTEKEFSAILSKAGEWQAEDKALIMEITEKILGAKKKKDEKILALYNSVKKALEEE